MTETIHPEISLVGSLLLDARCLPEVAATVTADDFSLGVCSAIFNAAVALDAEGSPIDPVSIRDRCAKDGGAVTSQFIAECMDVTSTAANAGMFARLTREGALRRSLATMAQELEERATGGQEPRQTLDYLADFLRTAEATDTSGELRTTQDCLLDFLAFREDLDAGEADAFLSTQLPPLDRLLGGGLLPGGLYIIGARPGMGKTTLGLWLADAVAQPTLFVSLEMGEREITAKRLARESGLPYTTLLMGALDEGEYGRLAQATQKLNTRPVTVNRKPSACVADIARMARRVPGLRLVIVDYLGLIRPSSAKVSRYEAITQISGALKQLARTLGVPVVALAQLNRETALGAKRPTLVNLRDSGSIEQDADAVLLLHNEAYYAQKEDAPPDPATPAIVECILAKNRHGPTGKTDLTVYFSTGRIYPVEFRRRG